MMDVRVSATEMGPGFEEQLNRVMRNRDRIIVQSAGADAVIVMSLAELEEWEDRLDLHDLRIARAESDESGEPNVAAEAFFRQLGL